MKLKGKLTLGNGYTLQMNMYTLMKLEELTGKNAFHFLENLESDTTSVTDMIHLYQACLIKDQPDITTEMAAEIFGDYPEAVGELLMASMPKEELGNDRKPAQKRKK